MKKLIYLIIVFFSYVNLSGAFVFSYDSNDDSYMPIGVYSKNEPEFYLGSDNTSMDMDVSITNLNQTENPYFYITLPTIAELAGGSSLPANSELFSVRTTIKGLSLKLDSMTDFYEGVEDYFSQYVSLYIDKINKGYGEGNVEAFEALANNNTISMVVQPRVLPMRIIEDYVNKHIDELVKEGEEKEAKKDELIEEARQLYGVYEEASKIVKKEWMDTDEVLSAETKVTIEDLIKDYPINFIKKKWGMIFDTDNYELHFRRRKEDGEYYLITRLYIKGLSYVEDKMDVKNIYSMKIKMIDDYIIKKSIETTLITGEEMEEQIYQLIQTIWQEDGKYKYKEEYYHYIAQDQRQYRGGIVLDTFEKCGIGKSGKPIIKAQYYSISSKETQETSADELLGTPLNYVSDYIQTMSQKPDAPNLNIAINQNQEQTQPLISFSQMEEGKDLGEYAHSTFFAHNPDLKIVKDEEKGNVLDFKYRFGAFPASVWFEENLPSGRSLDITKDKIKFSIRGLKGVNYPDSIVVRLIKKDGSFSEVVVSDGAKLEKVSYCDIDGNPYEFVGPGIYDRFWTNIEIPINMFVRENGSIGFGPVSILKKIRKFKSEDELKDVVKIAIVVRSDLNYHSNSDASEGEFLISEINL
jgi:hypothetical protein